ncbi:MAG: hypothetical protein WCH99_13975 [Verrucomicrobiota bacterium]
MSDANLDAYFSDLATLVEECQSANKPAHTMLENHIANQSALGTRIVANRKFFIAHSDKLKATPFLPIGFFQNENVENRLTLFTIAFEAETHIHSQQMAARLAAYSRDQPLFQKMPSLWDRVRITGERDAELINASDLEFIDGTKFVRFNRHFAQIDFGLNPGLIRWIKREFPSAPLYIRLDPRRAFDELSPSLLQEAIVRPIDPDWWSRLKIYPGNSSGCAHVLQSPDSPRDDFETWWEFNVKGIRALQMSVQRRVSGNFSAMIEELSRPSGNFEQVFGLMVHMDTDAAVGTTADRAILNHLDLAVNWYPDAAGQLRLNQRLDQGMVANAPNRAHLLRIENIPFSAFFGITTAFFESKVLLREWLSHQYFTTPSTGGHAG